MKDFHDIVKDLEDERNGKNRRDLAEAALSCKARLESLKEETDHWSKLLDQIKKGGNNPVIYSDDKKVFDLCKGAVNPCTQLPYGVRTK